MSYGATQVSRLRHRVVIQKIDNFALGGLHPGIALCRRLPATGYKYFQPVRREIYGVTSQNSFDVPLARGGRR
jgi:hypothetical protein